MNNAARTTTVDVNEMKAAFERVENKDDWKGAIDEVVVCADHNEGKRIADAVMFYTATAANLQVLAAVP